MKFLVINEATNTGYPVVMDEVVSAVKAKFARNRELKAKGKIECAYDIVGGLSGVVIYDVESLEELDLLIASDPTRPYTKIKVYPLVTNDDVEDILDTLTGKKRAARVA